jgi:hypothetical protein
MRGALSDTPHMAASPAVFGFLGLPGFTRRAVD